MNLAQSLHKLSTGHPGMVGPLVEQISPQAKDFLQKYMQAANVSIAWDREEIRIFHDRSFSCIM